MSRAGAPLQSTSDGLSVLFECAPWICAMPTFWLKGLLTVDEARLMTPSGAGRRHDPRAKLTSEMLLAVGSHWFAPWDFGQMVEHPSPASGWLLFQLRHADRDVPLALRVGACTAVQEVGAVVSLPRGLFRARQAAFEGAFIHDPGAGARPSVGLRINPGALWTPRELDQSARLTASAVSRPERRSHG